MSRHEIDVGCRQTGRGERAAHGALGPFRPFGERGQVVGIGRCAITPQFSVSPGAAANRVLHFFKHEDHGAFRQDKTVALGVIGTRCLFRGVEFR